MVRTVPLRVDALMIAVSAVSAMERRGMLSSPWGNGDEHALVVEWDDEGSTTEEYGFMWGVATYTREFLSLLGTGRER